MDVAYCLLALGIQISLICICGALRDINETLKGNRKKASKHFTNNSNN